MPFDLQSIADPRLILLSWSAGLALVAGSVTQARVVGAGFTWLSGGVAALVVIPGAVADDAWWGRLAMLLVVAGLVLARRHRTSGLLLFLAGIAALIEASLFAGPTSATVAAIALGGVTGEMLLGHWYLIDPRLPRKALRILAITGIVGLTSEATLLVALGIGVAGGAVGFWVLLVTSVGLMVAVLAALRYPAYSGVMAATGLSYLALLTTLGAVFVGRALVSGLGPFVIG